MKEAEQRGSKLAGNKERVKTKNEYFYLLAQSVKTFLMFFCASQQRQH